MKKIKNAILINLLFSLMNALLLLLFPDSWGELFGISEHMVFRLIGAGLLVFAFLLYMVRKKVIRKHILLIIAADAGWVAGSILLILFDPFSFSVTGMWITSILAAVVFWIAVFQYQGLKKASLSPEFSTNRDK